MAETTTPPLGDTEKKDNVVTPDDKQVLIDDLKKTMHDMGRIPAIIMAPIIAYVASQYEKIPEGRREKLQTIAASLKTKGIEGLSALKTWFAESHTAPAVSAPATPAQTDIVASTPIIEKKVVVPSVNKDKVSITGAPKLEKKKEVKKETEKKTHKSHSKKMKKNKK